MPTEGTTLRWYHRRALAWAASGGVPTHVAFIMDGNRRFARARKWPVERGHAVGFDALLRCLEWCLELGVKVVTVYAFSQDNFSRAPAEVEALMRLALAKFDEFLVEEGLVMQRGVKVRMWGRPELLPEDVRRAAARVVTRTATNSGEACLNVCFAYSAAEETARAARAVGSAVADGQLLASDVDYALLSQASWLRNDPPPDLLIRTSGETRLSDFMTMHVSRTKLCFLEELWPDLSFWTVLAVVLDWQRWRAAALESTNGAEAEADYDPARAKRRQAFVRRLEEQDAETWRAILQ